MIIEHLDKQTADGTAQNLGKLYQLFPSCFTETADVEGNIKRAINWGKLRELLGDNIADGEPEVYDFTWVGKRAAQREAMAPIRKTLRPCPEESVNWDTTQNLYIEGDNLEVLKLLQNSYMGKVKMIYIDPPYNTGNDFVYHDDFHRTQREEDEEAGVFNVEGERMVKNRVWFGSDGNSVPSIKKFASEVKQTMTPMTIWKYNEVGHSQEATQNLKKLFDNHDFFDYPKPVDLIKRCIILYAASDSLILDFFSGSSTAAHAVTQLNAEDGGNRKFIMVQWPEDTEEKSEACKSGYKNICEIGKERIRRAGKKIKEEHPEAKDLDIGFRVFKCDESNYKNVAFTPKDYSQESLELFVDNIKEDRSDLDLLFDCMLRWGITLDLPMTSTKVDGCKIHNVNEGALVACFEGRVTENVIDAICAMEPNKVVFRDSSFEEAAQKMNLFELFKQKLGWEEQEVRNNIRVI